MARSDVTVLMSGHRTLAVRIRDAMAMRFAGQRRGVLGAYGVSAAANSRFTEQTIDGFKLGSVLGRGAMGEIYDARRLGDDMPVAIKILAPHLMRDPSARDRFLRESEIVTALTSASRRHFARRAPGPNHIRPSSSVTSI